MVRQYSQKFDARNSSPNTSSIRLSSISSRVARNTFTRSRCARSPSANRPLVPASRPCWWVTRWSEKFGSSLFSQ